MEIVNLSMVMLIILNHYSEARKILHNVIQKKLLPPIVDTTTRQEGGIYWENHITLCEATKNLATYSVWHNKNFTDFITSTIDSTLHLLVLRCEMNRIIYAIFFSQL
jgi:hypothetical protein